tara:strand:- start:144862 stop:145572 length:711 start_codon:yes stop_codon:yes gene_type:complete
MDLKNRIMKTKYYIIFLGLIGLLASCEIDNFDEPQSFLAGNVVYNGTPVQVGINEVGFELWQPGFGKSGAIGVPLNEDGSFSSRLFDGNYKLVFVGGQGPFRTNVVNAQQLDTIFVDLKGDTSINIEVTPYFTFNSAQLTVSGNTINASCQLSKIISDATVENMTLFINKTQFVSNNNDFNIAQSNSDDVSDITNIDASVEIPELDTTQDYIFARIGVKIAGVEDLLFSPTEKITF